MRNESNLFAAPPGKKERTKMKVDIRIRKTNALLGLLLAAAFLIASCAPLQTGDPEDQVDEAAVLRALEEEDLYAAGADQTPLAAAPASKTSAGAVKTSAPAGNTAAAALPLVTEPVASGKVVKKNAKAQVDASNTADGYVMVKYTGSNKKVKVLVVGPSGTTYTYGLRTDGTYEVFPFSDGSGIYKVGVYENVTGSKYSTAFTWSDKVTLKDEFAPFLLPNQYVNYKADSKAVQLAAKLTEKDKSALDKIKTVYGYVIKNISYDKELAQSVKSGYIPNIDAVLAAKKGICFDYAALLTAMLRSLKIPAKLVVGYTGTIYHAWISTYTSETGWLDGLIYFNGKEWKLMDPTFASNAKSSASIMKYIGDGKNYSVQYLY